MLGRQHWGAPSLSHFPGAELQQRERFPAAARQIQHWLGGSFAALGADPQGSSRDRKVSLS